MKILIGYIGDGKAGGIDKYLLNFVECISSPDVQIHILTNKKNHELERFLKGFRATLIEIPSLKHPVLQYKTTVYWMKQEKYDMAYFNISTALQLIGPLAAYKQNIPKRAIHSHSSGNDCDSFWKRKVLDGLHRIGKIVMYRFANQYYGCSKAAGYWMFPKKVVDSAEFHMVYNAVDLDKFYYNEEIREKLRAQYHVENCLVLGHVGSFSYQKNHDFLIKVFADLVKVRQDVRLLLIGEGKHYERIKELAKTLNVYEKVLFLGWRNDVSDFYQMMDMFLLPSRFEGLPIVGVEAQGTNLKCLFSSNITREVQLTKEARFLPIDKSTEAWISCIIKESDYDRNENQLSELKHCYDLEFQKNCYKKMMQSK